MKERVIICDCHCPEHQLVISYFEDDPEDPFIYVQPRLNHLPFFKRLIYAFRYIFGTKDAWYAEVLLDRTKASELKAMIQEKFPEE